jgi:NDP-sugar pyrophosphorylase family protein
MNEKKARITITLPKEMLEAIDRRIDRVFFKNRSHTIECLLAQVIGFQAVRQAVILLGGKNAEKKVAILADILQILKKTEVKNLLIITGKAEPEVNQKLEAYSFNGFSTRFASSDRGSGGALKEHHELISTAGPFYVFNTSIFPKKLDLEKMAKFHHKMGRVATVYQVDAKENEVYVFEPEILRYIPNREFVLLEKQVLPELFKNRLAILFPKDIKI